MRKEEVWRSRKSDEVDKQTQSPSVIEIVTVLGFFKHQVTDKKNDDVL